MINRIFNALLGPATASSGSRVPSENWVTERIEAIKRAEQEDVLKAKREADDRERVRIAEYERQGRQVEEAVLSKICGGFYSALNPYLEFVRESHLEGILRDVEAATNSHFFLFIRMDGELRVPGNGGDIGVPIGIYLGPLGIYLYDIDHKTTQESPLISVDQIPGPDNFVFYGYGGIRPLIHIHYNSELVLRRLAEFEKKPTQTSFRVPIFNYRGIFDLESGHGKISINLDAPKKTIDVIGAETSRLTPKDLKNPEALKDAVVRAYVHPIVIHPHVEEYIPSGWD